MDNRKLKLGALVAIVVSSMIGSGIDSLPQNMAVSSAVGPVVLAWLLCGLGMYFIAQTFVHLSHLRPDLESGVYMYPREGFGPLAAFMAGWGYWLMTICSNVAFAVMVMDVLDYFVPGTFRGGNNLASIIGSSVLIWGFHRIVLSGTRTASEINFIGTIAKLIPLVVFVGVMVWAVDTTRLGSDIWGHDPARGAPVLGSIASQVMAPLFVAMWCFIGVEGAVALSGRAENPRDIGRATLIGFAISLTLCIVISVLPFGVMDQQELARVPNPSTAGVMEHVVGEWGEIFINAGVLISILSSWLAWTMICAEIPMAAARNGTFPAWFARCNGKGAAAGALWASSILMQVTVLLAWFSSDAWLELLAISSLMVLPAYFLSAGYLARLALGKGSSVPQRRMVLVTAGIGMAFCVVMLWSSSMIHVALALVLFLLGAPIYACRDWKAGSHGLSLTFGERKILGLIALAASGAVALAML